MGDGVFRSASSLVPAVHVMMLTHYKWWRSIRLKIPDQGVGTCQTSDMAHFLDIQAEAMSFTSHLNHGNCVSQ